MKTKTFIPTGSSEVAPTAEVLIDEQGTQVMVAFIDEYGSEFSLHVKAVWWTLHRRAAHAAEQPAGGASRARCLA